MKNRIITLKTIPFIFAIATFIFTFLININVTIMGDDYFYKTLLYGDLSKFINNQISQYLYANGKIIVNLLNTLFLSVDMIFWKIFNSLMLASIVFFGSKISFNSFKDKLQKNIDIYIMLFTCTILFSAIAFLDIQMTRQSVYWLIGSLNYVYPIVMLLVYWYVIANYKKLGKFKFMLPLLAFLSSATIEQVSLMAVGLMVITITDIKFIKKGKVDKSFYIALVISVIGCMSVLLAPGQFARIGLETAGKIPLMQLIILNAKEQLKQFLYAKYMLPFNILTILASGFCIYRLSFKLRLVYGIILRIFSVFSVLAIWFMLIKQQSTRIEFTLIDISIFSYLALYYFTSVLIALILLLRKNCFSNYIVPVIAIILCFGSQLMMVVSPVYGPRNVLCGVIMLAIYSASLIPVCFNFRFGVKMSIYINVIVITSYATLLILSILFMNKTIVGYKTNVDIDKANMEIAEQYKKNPTGTLKQSKLILEDFGWSMPYYSKYHEYYYKIFIGVDKNTVIEWN